MERRTFLRAGSTAAAALAGCVEAPGAEETVRSTERYRVPQGTRAAVLNRRGAVSVEPGDGSDVVKRSRFGRDELDRVRIERRVQGDVVTLATRYSGDPIPRVSVDVTARLPPDVSLARAETGSGRVETRDVTGDAALRTANGSLAAAGVDGYLTLASGNGSVEASDVAGIDGARTANGGLGVDVPLIRRNVGLSIGNGSVDAALSLNLDAALSVSVGNGSIDVTGPSLADVERARGRLDARLGDATHGLWITAGNGGVDLRSL